MTTVLETRIERELTGTAGLTFSQLRTLLGVDSATLHLTLGRMWSADKVRRIAGTRGRCRYVQPHIRPDVPGKAQYVAASQRAPHARGNVLGEPSVVDEATGTFHPLVDAGDWYGAVPVTPQPQRTQEVLTVCLGLADALTGEADMLLAEAQRHVKLAAALTEWATA